MVDKSELTRRKLLQGTTGAIALALGGGTPFLSSRAAYAAASDVAREQLRTIGLSVTVQDRILADFKAASGVGSTSGTAATFPDIPRHSVWENTVQACSPSLHARYLTGENVASQHLTSRGDCLKCMQSQVRLKCRQV